MRDEFAMFLLAETGVVFVHLPGGVGRPVRLWKPERSGIGCGDLQSGDPSVGRSGKDWRMSGTCVDYNATGRGAWLSEREFAKYFASVAERLSAGRSGTTNQVRWVAVPRGKGIFLDGERLWKVFSVIVLVDRNATVADRKFEIGADGWTLRTSKRVLYASCVGSWIESSLERLLPVADGCAQLFSCLQRADEGDVLEESTPEQLAAYTSDLYVQSLVPCDWYV
jgi:hypothetical protein